MDVLRQKKERCLHWAKVANKEIHKVAHWKKTDGNIAAVGATLFRSGVGWMSWRSCHSRATFGCSCVNPRPGLTTQERSSSGVAAALSPRCPLRLVEHVWKCDDVLNTQQSFCDPDVSGHRQSNERVNDLTLGGTFLLMKTPAMEYYSLLLYLKGSLGKGETSGVHVFIAIK